MTEHSDQLQTIAEIMRSTRIASLAYISTQGDLVSTPMGTQDLEHPGTVWFITERSTDKVAAIAADPRVNVHYAGKQGWVSLAGTARFVDDRERLRRLWDASAGAFMSGGPEDPENGLLEVTATSAEYWESPGAVATAVQLVKGLVTDGEPDLGDSGIVRL
ncbi:pyridoxamine 5'-phosphate oxidase family protein [Agrococcus sp. HG114]|uniref:pyridoxamine 5'-phosphate oxidase family protein n=1 Tax=Agrococcus sp. HG114 TaxID=2969757 RepID=UPI00215AFEF6|nr:pyridoxamine 5'-phosphate oxidase family protein [Agrococcus sp. HG114]MCR8671950.1 pyridoxamine 5'-phosphate oxidase family protein [Agrococcus sp. HG114]